MKNLLIVDDENAFSLSLKAGLEKHFSSLRVLVARNGKAAVTILESVPVNLVVTDLRMDEMDGLELLTYMTANFPAIPVVVMSAYGTLTVKNSLKMMGIIKFLDKPVDFQELTQAIREGLKHGLGDDSRNDIGIHAL